MSIAHSLAKSKKIIIKRERPSANIVHLFAFKKWRGPESKNIPFSDIRKDKVGYILIYIDIRYQCKKPGWTNRSNFKYTKLM